MSETEAPLLQLNGVSVVYDGHAVIDDLSLEVGRGEFVVIHGSTGCGKSTILRLFAGLIDPTKGEVVVAGDRIDEFDEAQRRWLRRSMGLMMQEELLLEDRTVLENVMLPALAADETAQEARRRALLALNKCGAADLADLRPSSLSAGQRQIACLARAVVNRPGYQLVFVDTPGIHKPKDGLGSELNKSALFELNDVDVVAFLIDATKPIGRGDAWVAERVKNARSKKVLVLTKADEADPAQVMEQLKAAHELMEYDDEIVTSSVKNFNVDAFIETVAHFLPEGPRWFPEDMGTDASDETLVAEFVREKVLRRTRDEIPHSVGVICDALEQTKKVLRVHATIYVEREGQKGIIIGKGGEMIKHIGIDARRDLERIFGTQVFLELDVKVKAGWRDDEAQIRRFGYNAED